MFKWLIVASVIIGSLIGYNIPTNAQESNCAPYTVISNVLLVKYGERPLFNGINNSRFDNRLVIFVNNKLKTYTIVLITRNENDEVIACVVSTGTNWSDGIDFPKSIEQPKVPGLPKKIEKDPVINKKGYGA